MDPNEVVTLKRECQATEIPSGKPITLYPGTEVRITQSLGGTFTVVTYQGIMVSISGLDGDALGKEVPEELRKSEAEVKQKSVEELVIDQLKTCYDPEIPHNIVDLGLIYECKVSDIPDGEKRVDIKMTLTAPGCGMGEWLKQDIARKVSTIPQVGEVYVDVVFDPPWNPNLMHPALRRALNL